MTPGFTFDLMDQSPGRKHIQRHSMVIIKLIIIYIYIIIKLIINGKSPGSMTQNTIHLENKLILNCYCYFLFYISV